MRFSLRTLLIAVLLLGSAGALYCHWQPWYVERILPNKAGGVGPVLISPDGRRLFTVLDNIPEICDLDGSNAVQLNGHEDVVWSACFSPDSRRVVTASPDGTSRVWDAQTGKMVWLLEQLGKTEVYAACFSPDGRWIAADNSRGYTHLWPADGATKNEVSLKGTLDHSHPQAAFSPDGNTLVTTDSEAGAIRLWSTVDGRVVASLQGRGTAVFSPDGQKILTLTRGAFWIIAAPEWRRMGDVEAFTYNTGAVFSHDSRRILGTNCYGARLWQGSIPSVPLPGSGPCGNPEFSPDDRRCLAVGANGIAYLWQTAAGRLLYLFGESVHGAQFSPDGAAIVTAHDDKSVRFWRKRREENLAGVLALPELWTTAALAVALVASLFSDRRVLKSTSRIAAVQGAVS